MKQKRDVKLSLLMKELALVFVLVSVVFATNYMTDVATGYVVGTTSTPTILFVNSSPTGALIEIDRGGVGPTPLGIVGITPGVHELRLSKTGYYPYSGNVTVVANQTTSVFVPLTKVTYANLTVKTTPPTALIYVDTVYRGTGPVLKLKLQQGWYALRVEKSGYYTNSSSVYLPGNSQKTVSVTLVPLPTGTLFVNSTPVTGASVYLDQVYKGLTPLTISGVVQGYHSVNLTKVGYVPYYNTSFYVVGNKVNTFTGYLALAGSLFVNSTPQGASITVDGIYKGLTPITVGTISEGNHAVKLTKSGYYDYPITTYIFAGQTTYLSITLIRLTTNETNQTGGLYVTSTPSLANVYVDSIYRGLTPIIVTNLSVGYRDVIISKTGYYTYGGTHYVSAGQTTNVSVILQVNSTNTTATRK
ncbi:MAG: PEGA domain-containing protein [Candidatus Aenigmarchaeota archaeon]|nr:PEGA domain-containing protein [Candidatus Aenigmarchaeota archaeon]